MRTHHLIVPVVLIFLTACSPKVVPNAVVESTPPVSEQSTPEAIREKDVERPVYMVASILKTPCFGTCPVLEAWVYSDSTAIWCGAEHSPLIGNYKATVSAKWLEELKTRAEAYGIMDMEGRYPPRGIRLEDVPMTVIQFEEEHRIRRIVDHADAPYALLEFEKYFLRHLLTLEWEKVSSN